MTLARMNRKVSVKSGKIHRDSRRILTNRESFAEPWFLKINPNGRIPCMIDRDNGDLKVWETGSMLRYLSEVYDKNYNLHFDNIEEETEMVRLPDLLIMIDVLKTLILSSTTGYTSSTEATVLCMFELHSQLVLIAVLILS